MSICGIYKIENLINHKIYIGQSINIQRRFQKHKKAKDNFYIHRAIQKYGDKNFSYQIIEQCNENQLNKRECYWIEYYNSLIPNGYNMISGGSNGAGKAKAIPVEQYSLDGQYIKTFPSARKAAQETGIDPSSICMCCNNKNKQAGLFQWKKQGSSKVITAINGIFLSNPILKYDLNGNFLKEYFSLQEAAKQNNLSKSSICRACKQQNKTAGNFQWKYKNSNKEIKHIKKQVGQYSLNNQLIKIFESCSDAHRKTGISLSGINSCCNKKRITAGKYKWKYI